MGVALAALWTLGALLAGAALTAWLEPRLVPAGAEPGPAAPAQLRAGRKPERLDPWMYWAGPVMAFAGAAWALVVIPFGAGLLGADLEIGLFYYLVMADFGVLGVALGGWGAGTPGSVEACYRIVAQLAAYVVPLGLAVMGPAMMARSLSISSIVDAQREAGLWYVLVQPQGFALYVAATLMQVYRAPFLEPFADRIDRGVLGVYGGGAALVWRVALSGLLFVASAMGAALFLGGPSGPWLPGPVWMVLKTLVVLVVLVVVGRRFRLRSTAETLALGWKVLVPLGLVNVLVVGGLILLGVGQSPFGK